MNDIATRSEANLVYVMLYDCCPDHSSRTCQESRRDLLERAEVDAQAAEARVDLSHTVRLYWTRIRAVRTNRSKTGISIINASGSRFERTSFGRPFVTMVAAWDVRLLFN